MLATTEFDEGRDMSGVCTDRSEYGSLDIEDGPAKYHSVRPSVDTKTKADMSWKGNT